MLDLIFAKIIPSSFNRTQLGCFIPNPTFLYPILAADLRLRLCRAS